MKSERLLERPEVFRKTAVSENDEGRLEQEAAILRHLEGSGLAPKLLRATSKAVDMEYIEGQSLCDWIHLKDDWSATPVEYSKAKRRLKQYIDLEEGLLDKNVLYRDMNLNHVIFTNKGVKIIDLEAACLREQDEDIWSNHSPRGTWETMAPEEFGDSNLLTRRTASYRSAILIHLVLTGKLPIRRVAESKSETYRIRRKHGAQVDSTLPDLAKRALSASLQVEVSRRHATPLSLWKAVEKAYEN